ncbi:thyroglobulin [Meleagris gallopavo]|uniref:thyroglobulin n=1 Tax=Meleagris gallopavo TaxID=9103 RepID=UPI00093E0FB1|nr:thyroglobulin [Meleagris gallopavo]
MSVLLFFHNGGSGNAEAGKTIIDGSYLAAISNTIVVTANYRVGVFGFLSVGSSEASGNAGLLDQLAALKWVQQNIGSFGGDPSRVSVGADRGGADIASIHLLTEAINMGLFRSVLLMGGSAFSPASIITKRRAQAQAAVLADDVGCPSSTSEEIVACLRQLPARVLNDAQTKLLAISGPFQYWGPVVDEVYLQEPLAKALQRPRLQKVDLLIGSAQQDGLISRAKAIKFLHEISSSPSVLISTAPHDSTKDLFYLMDDSQIRSDPNSSIPYQQYWVFRQKYSVEEAKLWCLTRCAQEDEFCQMADLQNTADTYFTCTLYPEAQICDSNTEQILENCRTELPWQPQALYRKIVTLRSTVKSFYTRVPFRKAEGISVRNVTDMSRKAVSDGFFECERWCDADPCCTGFGFLNVTQLSGGKIMCLTLNSLGIQTCAEESRSAWQISNCSLPGTEVRIHPFGWYQKPADLMNTVPNLCPTVSLPFRPESEYLDTWQPLNVSSVLVDSTISNFEAVHVSREISNGFATAKDYCLSACSRNQTCAVVTLEIRASAIRCLFYPDTQICSHGLEGHSCQLLLKEPATYIYRKQDLVLPISESDLAPSVYIPSHGDLIGKPQAVRIGTEWKNISQFLGIPYAAPPLAERRFNPPEPFAWEKTWNATVAR